MHDDEIKVSIAKALGWEFKGYSGEDCYRNGIRQCWSQVPDYATSLDAMFEAEEMLVIDGRYGAFAANLKEIVGKHHHDSLHASAYCRAKAFLKTINLPFE